MKKALVQDWFITSAGAEKCIKSFTNIWDDFDTFTLFDFFENDDRKEILKNKKTITSFLQNIPFAKKLYRNLLPLYPLAIEQFDLSKYDLILSSSHCVAKGVITNHNQLHICYMHTPIRYAWDLYHQYLEDNNLKKGLKGRLAQYILHKIRIWDINSSNRVDYYIANSRIWGQVITITKKRLSLSPDPYLLSVFLMNSGYPYTNNSKKNNKKQRNDLIVINFVLSYFT